MSSSAPVRPWILPLAWAVLVTLVAAVALGGVSWPFVDLYNNFYNAASRSWAETFAFAFGGGVEYRPLLIVGVKLAHQLAGLRLWLYQALVILQFAAILACFVWIFRAATWPRAVAASIALATVVGLHTSRVLFMFAPLNAHSLALLLLLIAVVLALLPRSPATEWAWLPLTLVALFVLESGALVVAVALVLWRLRAPGASGRAVVASLAAAAVYAAVRLGFGAQTAAATYAETGLGFGDVGAAQLARIFEHAPWLLWAYNYAASLLTVVLSEPTNGRYRFIESQLHGNTPLWQYIHLGTSLATTAIVLLARNGRSDARDRCIAAAGATILLAGSALGMLYTRDRIALSAGAGYAMLVYVGVAALLERGGRAWRDRAVPLVLVAVAAGGWLIRSAETWFELRDTAWEYYLEWTARYAEFGGARPQTDIMMILRRQATDRVPPDPRLDPEWTYVFFEREYERGGSVPSPD